MKLELLKVYLPRLQVPDSEKLLLVKKYDPISIDCEPERC